MGRHFVREENDEERLQLAVAADEDKAQIQGKEEVSLVAKVKIQKMLSLHVFHLSTFRPPVDNALWAHCRRRVIFINSKKLCVVPF